MVCEIQMRQNSGEWEAFLADNPPQALVDQLKKTSYDALAKTFQQLSPEIMLKAIPITMPMTHLTTASGKMVEGVAKYPLDDWISVAAPNFTTEKWVMICLLLAEKAMDATMSQGYSTKDKEAFEKLLKTASMLKQFSGAEINRLSPGSVI